MAAFNPAEDQAKRVKEATKYDVEWKTRQGVTIKTQREAISYLKFLCARFEISKKKYNKLMTKYEGQKKLKRKGLGLKKPQIQMYVKYSSEMSKVVEKYHISEQQKSYACAAGKEITWSKEDPTRPSQEWINSQTEANYRGKQEKEKADKEKEEEKVKKSIKRSLYYATDNDYGDDMDFYGDIDTDNQYTALTVYGTDNYHVDNYNPGYYRYNSIGPISSIYDNPDVMALLFVLGIAFAVCWCISLLFCGFGCGWIAKSKSKKGRDQEEVKYGHDHLNQV